MNGVTAIQYRFVIESFVSLITKYVNIKYLIITISLFELRFQKVTLLTLSCRLGNSFETQIRSMKTGSISIFLWTNWNWRIFSLMLVLIRTFLFETSNVWCDFKLWKKFDNTVITYSKVIKCCELNLQYSWFLGWCAESCYGVKRLYCAWGLYWARCSTTQPLYTITRFRTQYKKRRSTGNTEHLSKKQ
jgi:hypothetical protein